MSDETAPRPRRAPLTPAQQDLAMRYLPLARSLAKPYKASWPASRDEFESAACLALVEAAESFDPARNVKFATFARHRIWGALRDVQRGMIALGWRCDAAHAPTVGSLPRDVEQHGHVLGVQPEEPVGAALEAIDEIEGWLRKLPARHAAACREIYLRGKTQHEAARSMGFSQSRLSCIHREAMIFMAGAWPVPLGGDGASLADRGGDGSCEDE